MLKQEQAEVIFDPMNWDKQFGLPIAVEVCGQLRFIFDAPPAGAEVTLGIYVAPSAQVEVVLTATTG